MSLIVCFFFSDSFLFSIIWMKEQRGIRFVWLQARGCWRIVFFFFLHLWLFQRWLFSVPHICVEEQLVYVLRFLPNIIFIALFFFHLLFNILSWYVAFFGELFCFSFFPVLLSVFVFVFNCTGTCLSCACVSLRKSGLYRFNSCYISVKRYGENCLLFFSLVLFFFFWISFRSCFFPSLLKLTKVHTHTKTTTTKIVYFFIFLRSPCMFRLTALAVTTFRKQRSPFPPLCPTSRKETKNNKKKHKKPKVRWNRLKVFPFFPFFLASGKSSICKGCSYTRP